ncbi:Synergin gamma [Mytilus coruscus]|uniref:Synergin gamma n=1 Tax=Mytilus coruscus TaxID=42192 RepID=A0A6J8D840_MYTCO|nr:Synergin gamma [Mytilus coruscus]
MGDNRNTRMPMNHPTGNFGMQQFPQQYVQQGMVRYPMMQNTGHMMQTHGQMQSHGSMQHVQRPPNMMFPGQMGMRGPGMAPPPYRPTAIGQQYRANNPPARQPMSPESMKKMEKEKFYLEQKQKLKQFHTQETKVKQNIPAPEEEFNDSFGDFIGGPSANLPTQLEPVQQPKDEVVNTDDQPTKETNGNQSPRGVQQQKVEKKVDINTMMMECSDLTAPVKAKTFHKPTLKEVNPSHHGHTAKQHESKQAKQWKQMNLDDLGDMFVVEGPAMRPEETTPDKKDLGLPHWCKDEAKIPELYKHVLEASVVEDLIQTDRLYPILILSGLPKEVLGQIWSMCNKMTPGQLIKEELYLILGFIFLAQNQQPLSIELLHRIPHAPTPFLAPPQHFSQPNQFSPATTPPINQPTTSQTSSAQPCQPTGMPSGINTVISQIPPSSTTSSFGQTTFGMTTSGSQGQITPIPSLPGPIAGPSTDSWHSHNIGAPVNQGATGNQTTVTMTTSGSNLSMGEDDDFADFQEAPKITKEVTKVKITKPAAVKEDKVKPVSAKEDKKDYLYSVPLPDDELPEHQLSTEQHYSNVSNFFGSDDSSGASTPNSMDDDFDDFKSAGRPSDSSQFTSSEQSENEDFKVLESYLDDFSNKKKDIEKQESPLHRPISKTTNLPPTAYNNNVNPIPAIKSLWPKPDDKKKATATPKAVTLTKAITFSPQSSDSEFADFQQAPQVVTKDDNLSASKSATDLIGDEDKYAAFRTLETIDTSGPSIFGKGQDDEGNEAEDEGEWADFQSTETIVAGDQSLSDNLFDSAANSDSNNDWSGFSGAAGAQKEADMIKNLAVNTTANDDWSNFSTANQKSESDDWADFQGPSENIVDSTLTVTSSMDETPAPIISVSQSDLVTVKKKNLQHNEILGLFKPRDDPSVLTSYKLPDLSQDDNEGTAKQDKKGYLETSIDQPAPFQQNFPTSKEDINPPQNIPKLSVDDDDDFFRVPPPMDEGIDDEDEYGDFSQGYDIDDVTHTPHQNTQEKKKIYSMYGMEFTTQSKSTKEKTHKKTDSDSSNQFTFATDSIQFDTKINKGLKPEDTNSVSSLELPFSKNVLNVKDSDSVSISSNEFAADFPQIKSLPDSKSIDSLDLKISEPKSGESKSADSSDMEEKSENDEQKEETDADKVTEEITSKPDVTSFGGPTTKPVPLFGDRYSGIMEDITGSDKYAYEWQRCLENCYRNIKEANNIFNSISSSGVCNEVIRSEQGTEYVQGIVEIYRIVCRITVSMKSAALSTDKLGQVLKDVDLVWNNLAAFLVGGNIMPDDNALSFKNCLLKSDDVASQMRACGVCLLDVDVRSKDFNTEEEASKLTYGGRQYHATCANFWVNCVDSMLPSLKLPELL